MPHSTGSQEDIDLPDAPSQHDDSPSTVANDDSQRTIEGDPLPSDSMDHTQQSLDTMFDDDDDEDAADDEFSSSAPAVQAASSSQIEAPAAPTKSSNSRDTDPEIMRAFYGRLLPFRYLFQWLNHGLTPSPDFSNREFAFTLPNDAYLRYQSFTTADLLRKECMRLNPSRFEIGPVYSANPRERKTLRKASAFRPLSKELVFDIDMTDYDEIRTCCSGAKICAKCWSFITMAIRVVDAALREDFGFQHILWVYSGRRGAHAWVSDKRAREMDDAKRRAIAGYLELLKGGDKGGKKVNVKRPLHPHLERSLQTLRSDFQGTVLQDQDPWRSEESAEKLLKLLPNADLVTALRKKWDSAPDRPSSQKWQDLDRVAETVDSDDTFFAKRLLEAKQDIVLEYTYPRLDAEVSKKLNHLLKSPFCVHPGTGRVCVPIDVRRVEEFDPLAVPTVGELLREIDAFDSKSSASQDAMNGGDAATQTQEEKKVADWEKTSLKPYVDYFRSFVARLLQDEKSGANGNGSNVKRGREEGDAMEF